MKIGYDRPGSAADFQHLGLRGDVEFRGQVISDRFGPVALLKVALMPVNRHLCLVVQLTVS